MEIGYIKPREIVREMQESYLDYAMSVIISRALPDVRDGLKPVHRRILYAMWDIGLRANAKFRKSAAIVGECFVKDTLILTREGLIPIQNIQCGNFVYTQNNLQKVTRLYRMPPKPLLKINLENGNYNIATPSQKIKIIDSKLEYKWKKAKDLTQKDYVVNKAFYPKIKNEIFLNKFNGKKKFLNKNIAYALGLLISDGWLSKEERGAKYRLGFYSQNLDPIKKIQNIFKTEFNYLPTIEVKNYILKTKEGVKKHQGHTIRICHKGINEFFLNNFDLAGKNAFSKEIPNQIFISPPEIIFAFISGLIEGDGSVALRKNCIHYGSISEKLIHGLQILLQQFDIIGSRYINIKNGLHYVNGRKIIKRYPFYYIEYRGKYAINLAVQLTLYNQQKNQKIIYLQEKMQKISCFDAIPYAASRIFTELSNFHLGGGWHKDVKGNKFREGIKYQTGCKIRYSNDLKQKLLTKDQAINWGIYKKLNQIGSKYFKFLDKVLQNHIYFLRIKSIEKYHEEITYDLEVEKEHEFIANGMVSHNCLGKYHPHGDIAVYDSLVRMAQEFSMRYPLIHGQGNFGSIDGDSAAAQRYTEAKLSKISEELLYDLEKETVNFIDNYDASHKEPQVLPAKLPNVLLNGSMGIAVGMATNIPPHNLGEIIDAATYLIDHKDAAIEDLTEYLKGPDFPTAGYIFNKKEILQVYAQGKGAITMRGKAEISESKKGAFSIVITELPYQVNKAQLVEKIAELVTNKKLEGIRDVRDESDKDGIRVVIDLKREAFPKKVLNRLYHLTQLQEKFHVNMLALVDGIQPRVLNLKSLLGCYIDHRKEVVTKRAQFDLKKAKERAHILEGLKKALDRISEVIKVIKQSKTKEIAQNNLVKKFRFTVLQAQAILEMRLAQLAGLERKKIEDELIEKKKLIKELIALLASPKKILGIVKKELQELKEKYGDERRTKIVSGAAEEFTAEDLIPKEDVVITLTYSGYIKSLPENVYRSQARGGKGVKGMEIREEDIIEHFFVCNTHSDILFFTNSGKVFQLKAYEIPKSTRTAKGQSTVNFLQLAQGERTTALVALKSGADYKYLAFVTKYGLAKKVELEDFKNVRRSGLIAIRLKKDDELKWVKPTSGQDDIIVVTSQGQSIRFKEKDARPMGRAAAGVRVIRLKGKDEVIGMDVIKAQSSKLKTQNLLIVTENGYGKKSALKFYKIQHRGGSGIKTAKITSKNGRIVFAKILDEEIEELIIISKKGQVIRIETKTISEQGRATQGVRIMRLKPGDKVASVAYI